MHVLQSNARLVNGRRCRHLRHFTKTSWTYLCYVHYLCPDDESHCQLAALNVLIYRSGLWTDICCLCWKLEGLARVMLEEYRPQCFAQTLPKFCEPVCQILWLTAANFPHIATNFLQPLNLTKPVANIDSHRHLWYGRGQLDVPRVRLLTYGGRTFCYAITSAWNALPDCWKKTVHSLSACF